MNAKNAVPATAPQPGLVRDPVYQQLNDLLQALIHQGEFQPGQRFLSEREVSERYGVSRLTANKAISHLVVAGALELRKGIGTFVRDRVLNYDLQALVSFSSNAKRAGKNVETRVLQFRELRASQATEGVRAALKLEDDEPLFHFQRLRFAVDEPVILESRYLLQQVCPGLKRVELKGSLYALLSEKYGQIIETAEQRIQAVCLSKRQSQLLGVPCGSPALQLIGTATAKRPIWFEKTLYRGDRYEFCNQLGAGSEHFRAGLVICDSLHAKRSP